MKNKQIIESWNKIEPDSAADERILSAILTYNHSGKSEKKKVYPKTLNRKRLALIAACFVVAIALVGIFGKSAGWFGGKVLSTNLDDGTLNFYKSNSISNAASLAWDIDWGNGIHRELTADESKALFGKPGVSGYAIFRSTDNTLLHFEGKAGKTKIILAASGAPVTDTIVEGNEKTSEINGIPVTAGYFVTNANSQGIKNIIYFASFKADETSVYVELGGVETDSNALRAEIAGVVYQLTKNHPNIAAVMAK